MIPSRKAVRQRLKCCSRAEYDALVYSAKLTPIQNKILNLFILENLPIFEISYRVACCESLVRRRLAEVYDKIAKL